MFSNILATGFLLGILCTIFYTPYLFCKGIYTIEYGVISLADRLVCSIPILNICKSERLYTGKVSKVGISTILFLLSFTVRFVVIYQMPENVTVQILTMILVIIFCVVYYICNLVVIFQILNDADCMSFPKSIIYAIFYPIGQYYVGTYLPRIIKNIKNEKETF